MDLKDYFQVIASDDLVLHIQIKNFWSDVFVDECGTEFVKVFKCEINKFRGSKFILVTDQSQFKGPGEKAEQLIAKSLRYCQENNIYLAIDLNPSPLGYLGVGRILKDAHLQDNRVVMKSMEEVQKFIDSYRRKMK